MDRLTIRTGVDTVAYVGIHNPFSSPMTPAEMTMVENYPDGNQAMREVLRKLAAYEDAEHQGHVCAAPVEIGQTVYRLVKCACGKRTIKDFAIKIISFYGNGIYGIEDNHNNTLTGTSLGRYWFLYRKDAEDALAQTGDENEKA